VLFFSYQFLIFLFFAFLVSKIAPNQIGFFITSIMFYLVFGSSFGLFVALFLTASLFAFRSEKIVILISLATLIFFKYSNFLFDTFHVHYKIESVFILGLSFFVFEIIHLAVERSRGSINLNDKLNIVNFIFFWPTMVAGPIKRYNNFSLIQFFSKDKNDYFLAGIMIFAGYLLKYFSDNLSAWINAHDGLYIQSPQLIDKFQFLLILGLRIYWDFAGYSLIAIGFARIFGVKVPQNFNYPYFTNNIISFWKNWHISLSTWIRDYVYIPLGGNRKHKEINLLIAMALCGLWHGASVNFLFWGLMHGVALVLCHMSKNLFTISSKGIGYVISAISFAITQLFVFIMWLPFFYPLETCLNFFSKIKL